MNNLNQAVAEHLLEFLNNYQVKLHVALGSVFYSHLLVTQVKTGLTPGGRPLKQQFLELQIFIRDGAVDVYVGNWDIGSFPMGDPEFPHSVEQEISRIIARGKPAVALPT